MKWGAVFCKKKWKMGFFVKKWKGGVFFCKKWTFPRRRVHYVQYQYFFILHFTPNAPLCLRACHMWQSHCIDSLTTEHITNAHPSVVMHLTD